MPAPPLNPPVDDAAPSDAALTDYDREVLRRNGKARP